MLSAVAARKARLEDKNINPAGPEAIPDPSVISPPPASRTPKPPSKRKPSSQTNSSRKKPKRQRGRYLEERPSRPFQDEDVFKRQEDMIIVDDSDSSVGEGTSMEEPVQSSFGRQSRVRQTPISRTRTKVPVAKRAWSPSAPLPDSSDDEGESTAEDEVDILDAPLFPQSSRPVPDAPQVLSNLRPVLNHNVFPLTSQEVSALRIQSHPEGGGAMVLMSESETLTLMGTYRFCLLGGIISISGTVLRPSGQFYEVFAPRSSPLPVINCLSHGTLNDAADLPSNIRTAFVKKDAMILIQELKTGVEGLGRVCRTFEGVFEPSRWQSSHISDILGLSGVRIVMRRTHDIQPSMIPDSWATALTSIESSIGNDEVTYARHAYLVRGSKKTGKSTFAKMLLNRLTCRYRKVAFLECDVGQSEFTPGAMVALNIVDQPIFGPSFTHPSIPYLAHYIGSTSPRSSPSHYLESVQALVQSYNLDIQHAGLMDDTDPTDNRISDVIPLVVNTMGWTKGLGANIAQKIEEMIEPSHVFNIEFTSPEEGWLHGPTLMHNQYTAVSDDTKMYTLEPIASTLTASYSAADHRTFSILSYFHAVFPSIISSSSSVPRSVLASSWNTTTPLCANLPYEVNCSSAVDQFILTGPGSEDVVSSEVHHVLNGAIVGLVSCDPGTLDDPTPNNMSSGLSYIQAAPPPSPQTSQCHALALVRSLATRPVASSMTTLLHILTPLPPDQLGAVAPRVLVKGELQLPVWGMLDFRGGVADADAPELAGEERVKVPYLRWGKSEGVGGERRRVRRNLMRRAQM